MAVQACIRVSLRRLERSDWQAIELPAAAAAQTALTKLDAESHKAAERLEALSHAFSRLQSFVILALLDQTCSLNASSCMYM